MRQNKLFPIRPQPEPEPPAPPSRAALLRQRAGRYYKPLRGVLLVAAGILIAFTGMYLYGMTQPPPQRLTQRDINNVIAQYLAEAPPPPSFQSLVYEVIRPSLVRVRSQVNAGGKTENSVGTGVVIDDAGTILTSLHVVRNSAQIRVTFADGSESEAVVVISQPENDLAVLRPSVIPDDLIPATLGGGLRVGDDVVAVGNPFGISNSLTSGVVSGLRRSFRSPKTGETLTNVIQFDAAVNPGNSGGPLLDRGGNVVGIVTGLLNPTEQEVFIGIGFAVPIETAMGGLGSPPD